MEDDDRDDLTDALLSVAGALVGISLRGLAAGATDVTLAQHRVLVLIEETGVMSVNDVALELGVNQSNASRHCSRLAALGLVVRRRAHHDGRATELRLTATGRRHVRDVRSARQREIRALLTAMEVGDAPSVTSFLRSFERATRDLPPSSSLVASTV